MFEAFRVRVRTLSTGSLFCSLSETAVPTLTAMPTHTVGEVASDDQVEQGKSNNNNQKVWTYVLRTDVRSDLVTLVSLDV